MSNRPPGPTRRRSPAGRVEAAAPTAARLAKAGSQVQNPTMTARATLLIVACLAGCATAAPEPAPRAGGAVPLHAAPDAAGSSSPAVSAGPSDWALAIVGTPFVFAFRVVTCAATAVVAGPTAGLLALSDQREAGLDYLRWGLAENCDGPYVVPVPVAAGYRAEPDVRYAPRPDVREYPAPDLGMPRPLTPYGTSP